MLIGDCAVGKSSLLRRLQDVDAPEQFDTAYNSTIGVDFVSYSAGDIGGKQVKLQVWDTSGQERFHCITQSYYRSAEGLVLIYDVTSRESFESCSRWMEAISAHCSPDLRMVLVGNKSDLVGSRRVSLEEGQNLARTLKVHFLETSAKTGDNSKQVFRQLAEELVQQSARHEAEEKGVVALGAAAAAAAQHQRSASGCC